jgi:hypothetical protein
VLLKQYSRFPFPLQEAKRKVRIFSLFCRSAMNFARASFSDDAMRNSGSVWRNAFATTNSDGGMPGRMVRSQEPNESHTTLNAASAWLAPEPNTPRLCSLAALVGARVWGLQVAQTRIGDGAGLAGAASNLIALHESGQRELIDQNLNCIRGHKMQRSAVFDSGSSGRRARRWVVQARRPSGAEGSNHATRYPSAT